MMDSCFQIHLDYLGGRSCCSLCRGCRSSQLCSMRLLQEAMPTQFPSNSQAYQNSIETCPFNVNDDYRFHFGNVIPAPYGNQSGDKYCERRERNGDCAVDVPGMGLFCLKSCGFCAEAMTEKDACFDRLASAECKKLADQKECFLNPTYMTFNCRHTCRACPKALNTMVASNHLQQMEIFVEELVEEVESMNG